MTRNDLRTKAAAKSVKPLRVGKAGILITGANGFLGSQILAQMSREEPVYCLVRSADKAEAMDRLRKAAHFQRLSWNPDNIVPLCGDLGTLADCPPVRAIWHLAAALNLRASADELWPINVEPLHQLATHPNLTIASTLSVFVSTEKSEGTFIESDKLEQDMAVYGGYAQTKTAAEFAAPDSTAIRYGLLTGSTETGIFPSTDFFTLVLSALRKLGAYCHPTDPDTAVDVTPVDLAARAWLSLEGQGGVFHFANRKALRLVDMLGFLSAEWGLKEVSQEQFVQGLQSLKPMERRLISQAFFRDAELRHFNYDLFQSTRCTYDMTRTSALFGEIPNGLSERLLDLYVSLVPV